MTMLLAILTMAALWADHGVVAMTGSCTVTTSATTKVTCTHIDQCSLYELVRALQNASTSGKGLTVVLDNSVVSDFPSTIFEGYSITELDIHLSILEEFPHGSFFGLSQGLRRLDLSQNTVQLLNSNLLKNLPFKNSLTYLSLYQNALTTIRPFAFVELPALTYLDLSRNTITDLPDYTFQGLIHLTELQLAGNRIATIGVNALPRMDALVTLNLGDNWLATLVNDTFSDDKMPAIANVWLPYNVFTCDCNLQWLKDWLTSHGILDDSRGTCEQPTFDIFKDVTFCTTTLSRPLLTSGVHHNAILKIKEHVELDG